MIVCLTPPSAIGNFDVYHRQGKSGHLLVNIPGFLKPKSRFFDIWNKIEAIAKLHSESNPPFFRWLRISRKAPMARRICRFARNRTSEKIIEFDSQSEFCNYLIVCYFHHTPICSDCLMFAEPLALLDEKKECFMRKNMLSTRLIKKLSKLG